MSSQLDESEDARALARHLTDRALSAKGSRGFMLCIRTRTTQHAHTWKYGRNWDRSDCAPNDRWAHISTSNDGTVLRNPHMYLWIKRESVAKPSEKSAAQFVQSRSAFTTTRLNILYWRYRRQSRMCALSLNRRSKDAMRSNTKHNLHIFLAFDRLPA